MIFTYLFLAISLSIDSIGIGITYGIKNTKIPFISKVVLFSISLLFTSISIIIGNCITHFISTCTSKLIGAFILILMGIWIIIQMFINKNNYNFDIDNSNTIDLKEALFLGIALSIDSISVSLGSGIAGMCSFIFPIFISSFLMIFLFLGNFIGKKIINIRNFPNNLCSIISGIILILIGISRLI